ncbi:PEPxxWA-CTERM sorting domain-containing protein [Phenylobacterium sp.]|uniref:PEPxxWA-CTERM sorting domain-containing protein n=1 Tax=Phenylobacterium sp. TaxID=1871053 RepID=UPI003BA9356D
MHRSGAIALLAATAFAAAAPVTAQAATFLTVGASSLCGPAGCFAGAKKSYTQTFSASQRAGTFDVSQLQVAKSVTAGAVDHTAVRVTFILADGTEVSWGKFSLAALGGDVVTLGGQAVAWNAAAGDLTVRLDLVVPEKPGAGGGGFGFGGGGGGGGWAAGGGGADVDGGGFTDIVQGRPLIKPAINQPSVAAIPEPGAWALMILGFGAAGAMLRRRTAYHLRYG